MLFCEPFAQRPCRKVRARPPRAGPTVVPLRRSTVATRTGRFALDVRDAVELALAPDQARVNAETSARRRPGRPRRWGDKRDSTETATGSGKRIDHGKVLLQWRIAGFSLPGMECPRGGARRSPR